jgi:hydroxymethylpyrimidine/phosphomethylpyrimidine kinase
VALSIAGSDPSGGAGIQADLKTFAARGVYGMAVITALTAQNTCGVTGVVGVDGDFIRQQIETVFDDIRPHAIKVGMVGTAAIAAAVADGLAGFSGPIVVDPVMVATSGAVLLAPDAETTLRDRLVPRATLVTPNIPEAQRLLDGEAPERWAARTGVALLLKDGHNDAPVVSDRLVMPDGTVHRFRHPRVPTRNTHGTGCSLSSAIAAELAGGAPLPEAVGSAVEWLAMVISESAPHTLGSGHGPLLHGGLLRARLPSVG